MATMNKITEMIGAIKTIYPYYAKDNNVEVLVKTWALLLKSYPDDAVEAAFYKCLQVCKMPPTPADVIEQIRDAQKSLDVSDEELWSQYIDALRITCDQVSRFGYTFVDSSGISQGQQARRRVDDVWNGLPDKIKHYLGSKGELMRNAQSWGNDANFANYEKPRFLKNMPIMEKREEYRGLMLGGGDRKMLNGG